MTDQSLLTFDIFSRLNGFVHGFSTRRMQGGTSTGPFHNFNLGNFQHDEKKHIEHNRSLFFQCQKIDRTCVAYAQQIHSGRVRLIDQPGIYSDCDALVTKQRDIYLTIQTADCFPVFLVEPEAKIVSLVHAGWQGVIKNIIEHSIETIVDKLNGNPSEILAAIGPGLQSECFEVRADVFRYIPQKFCTPHTDKSKRLIDLAGFIGEKLIALGLLRKNIEISMHCTKCRSDLFFSYRRDGIKSGRMMGVLGIC